MLDNVSVAGPDREPPTLTVVRVEGDRAARLNSRFAHGDGSSLLLAEDDANPLAVHRLVKAQDRFVDAVCVHSRKSPLQIGQVDPRGEKLSRALTAFFKLFFIRPAYPPGLGSTPASISASVLHSGGACDTTLPSMVQPGHGKKDVPQSKQ